MDAREAIQRIQDHIDAHSRKERFAVRITEALKMAINALEKQIPKKPIKREEFLKGKHTVTVALCPNCDSLIGLYNFAKTSFKCCCECGQALNWSDCDA